LRFFLQRNEAFKKETKPFIKRALFFGGAVSFPDCPKQTGKDTVFIIAAVL